MNFPGGYFLVGIFSQLFIVFFQIDSCLAVNGSVPMGKILNSIDEDDAELESRVGNKSQKILTRPQVTTTTAANPYYMYPQHQYHPQNQPGFIGQDAFPQESGQYQNVQQAPMKHESQDQSSGVPEIYVQLIGAIEKLVARMDKIDNRLRTAENILLHMTNKKPELPDQGSCPNNFKKVEGVRGKCFQVSSFSQNPMIYDWKSAENECTKNGGRLVEMLNYDDFIRVSQFLLKYHTASNSVSSDFWIGGINPGLIWIWAESGQPVDMNKRYWNDNDNGSSAPGCLKLSYSHRLNAYFFKHSPCGHSQNYICEILDNTVSRALARFEETLWSENSTLADMD